MTYFQTDNPAVASNLAMLCVPVPETPEGPFPMLMMYTPEHLKALGYGGVNVREAGHRARKEKKAGIRVWQFVPNDDFHEFMAGWKEGEASHPEGKSLELPNQYAKDLGRWAYYFNEQRKLFLTTHNVPTYIAFHGKSSSYCQDVDGKRVSANAVDQIAVATVRGTFSCVSIDAPLSIWKEVRA